MTSFTLRTSDAPAQAITGNYLSDGAWLLRLERPDALRVLFLANYAPANLTGNRLDFEGDGNYPDYHHNVFLALKDLGLQVYSSSSPNALFTAARHVDYVYSLLNRMHLRDSEVLVSAMCEFLGLPYLGAPPTVRAVAADKYLFKTMAKSLGLQVPKGILYRCGEPSDSPPAFDPPYFIKDRTGAASEGIDRTNIALEWEDGRHVVATLQDRGKDVLVEEFCSGIDLTVPVIGGVAPHILGFVEPQSDEPGNIVTHSLKLDDRLGYRLIEVPSEIEYAVCTSVEAIWDAIGPIDYFRLDFRYDSLNLALRLLEMNICCHFEEGSAITLSAASHGVSFHQLLEHILSFSLSRQRHPGQQLEWVL
jgi:D-alanine-D-alanine ligase